MKRRDYRSGYLRGLGIGIVVTALILTITGGKQETLSDDQIRARAAELGMVEETKTLADSSVSREEEVLPESEEVTVQESVEEAQEQEILPVESVTEDEEAGEMSVEEAGAEASENIVPDSKETEVPMPVVTEEPQEEITGTVTITIPGGTGSGTVCRMLEEAGLIEDAKAYDRYLQDQGYSRNIQVGDHEILRGAGWEEIAQNITGKG